MIIPEESLQEVKTAGHQSRISVDNSTADIGE